MATPLSPSRFAFPVASPSPSRSATRSSSPTALARFKQFFRTSSDELEELHAARTRSSTMPAGSLFAHDFVDARGGQEREWRGTTAGGARSGSSSGGIGESPQARARSSTTASSSSHASTLFPAARRSHSRSQSGASSTRSTPSDLSNSDPKVALAMPKHPQPPTMVDPRFAGSLRSAGPVPGALGLGSSLAPIMTRSHSTGGNGVASGSFVATLGLAPLVDASGHELPLHLPASRRPTRRSFFAPVAPDSPTEEALLDPDKMTQYSPRGHRSSSSPPGLRASSPPQRTSTVHKSKLAKARPRKRSQSTYPAERPALHGTTPVNLCEAYTFPRPRLAPASPPGTPLLLPSCFLDPPSGVPKNPSYSSSNLPDPASYSPPPTVTEDGVRRKDAKGKQRSHAPLERGAVDFADDASVRRVIRENRASQLERSLWASEGAGWGGGRRQKEKARRRSQSRARVSADETEPGTVNVTRLRLEAASAGSGPDTPPDSPPTPRSFDGFAALVGRARGFPMSRSRERKPSVPPTSEDEQENLAEPNPAPATTRTLRPMASLDSLYARPNVLARRMTVSVGKAISDGREVPQRRPSVVAQNAFLSLPPHLHHLLQLPHEHERQSMRFIPSRDPPPIPRDSPPFSAHLSRLAGPPTPRARTTSDYALLISLPPPPSPPPPDFPASPRAAFDRAPLELPLSPPESPEARPIRGPKSSWSSFQFPDIEDRALKPQPSVRRHNGSSSTSREASPSLRYRRFGAEDAPPTVSVTVSSVSPTTYSPTLGRAGLLATYFDPIEGTFSRPLVRQQVSGGDARSPGSINTPTSQGSGGTSMLNLDEEGSSFNDLFIRPPPDDDVPSSPSQARVEHLSVSSYASTDTPPSEEEHTITFEHSSSSLEDTSMTFGVVSHVPLVADPRYSVVSHQAEQGYSSSRRESLANAFASRRESMDEQFRSRRESLTSTSASEGWATAEEGGNELDDADGDGEGSGLSIDAQLIVGGAMAGTPLSDLPLHPRDVSEPSSDESPTSASFVSEPILFAQVDSPAPMHSQASWAATSFARDRFPDASVDVEAPNAASAFRPAPTPSQGFWSATSFAREYFGDDDFQDTRSASAPLAQSSFLDFSTADSLSGRTLFSAPPRLQYFASESSFIDFEDPAPPPPLRSAASHDSFLDVDSPPASPGSRPHVITVHDVDGDCDELLPPTPSYLRRERLSVDLSDRRGSNQSQATRRGSNQSSDRRRSDWSSSGYTTGVSNASHTSLINDFPDPPPVEPFAEPWPELSPPLPPSPVAEMEEEEDAVSTLHSVPSMTTLRPRRSRSLPSLSTLSLTNSSDWTVESTDLENNESGVRRGAPQDDDEESDDDNEVVRRLALARTSFLDLSSSPERLPGSPSVRFVRRSNVGPVFGRTDDSSIAATMASSNDSAARRWSGSSWLTFFSRGCAAPLTGERAPEVTRRTHERTSSDPAVFVPRAGAMDEWRR